MHRAGPHVHELPGQSLSRNTWGTITGAPAKRWDQQYAQTAPETSYASCGDLSLAYQVFGDGPVDLVFVAPFTSDIELVWTVPELKAFLDQLATFCRVDLFDKAVVGMSDPVPHVRTLDDRAAEIEAVMDAAGFGHTRSAATALQTRSAPRRAAPIRLAAESRVGHRVTVFTYDDGSDHRGLD
jgi:hypothetical protein